MTSLQMIPVIYILMENRKTESYDNLFAHLTEKFPNLKPSVISLDFEKATEKSLRKFFPEAIIIHCSFHFSQVIHSILLIIKLRKLI